MNIIQWNASARQLSDSVATIGFFDGVHVGHRHIIDSVVAAARSAGLLSTVITFSRHPRQVLCAEWHPQLLSTLDEKASLLAETGVDQLVVLPFDTAMAAMPARQFMSEVLQQQLGVRILITGYDNHFGHREKDSTEGFDDYVAYGREIGMTVLSCTPVDAGGLRVSSSTIRQLLYDGDVRRASLCLGRPYALTGTVVRGEHVGTGLGFPTANLLLDAADKLLPLSGAYAVRVRLEQSSEVKYGMMNIGSRPTFDGHRQTIEIHIFRFSGDIYGQRLQVWFVDRLRPEMKFDSREALASQLASDVLQAESIFDKTLES